MMEIVTLHTLDTEYSANSIEWCPYPGYQSHFACGTYQLQDDDHNPETKCNRLGRIYLYKFDSELKSVQELHRVETAAILDMKWLMPVNAEIPILVTANALGHIEVFALQNYEFVSQSSFGLNPEIPDLLALSVDWRSGLGGDSRQILSSDSKGNIHLMDYSSSGLNKINSWKAHRFEAWTCTFDKWDTNLVFTGSDDTMLYGFDIRTYEKSFKNIVHHAGVTSLLSHPKLSNILLTGCYDDELRMFDTRSMKKAITDIGLNGGIWRLKPDPLDKNLVLAACMYHNFSIVNIKDEEKKSFELVGEFNEHKSICYGADWCQNNQNENEQLFMATCSFYDHKLCVASVDYSKLECSKPAN